MPRTGADCIPEWLLAAFVEGVIAGEDLTRTELHLAGCDECRRVLAAIDARTGRGTLTPTTAADNSSDELAPGVLVGRYVVRALVGAGAMGMVYEAHDPELDRRVAIKVLHARGSSQAMESLAARMRREAQAMARLSHPNVVAVHDVGTVEGRVFLAMEFVEGSTLRRWLEVSRPWRDVLDGFAHAGRGLAAAHAAGLVHRDFKPDNVLVGKDGRVRVTDFGLARMHDDGLPSSRRRGAAVASAIADPLSRTGQLAGTPAYMAPEALAGGEVDARSDVFSFGVALHEGLFGQRPYAGRTMPELRASIAAGHVRETRGRGVPGWLRRAVLKGVRPDRAERYSSIDEMLEAVRASATRPRRWLTVAIVAAGLAGALAFAGTRGHSPGLARPSGRPTLAVLPLRAASGDTSSSWLAIALSESLRAQLDISPQLQIVPGAELARRSVTSATAAREVLGADYVVEGTYSITGDPAHRTVQAHLQLARADGAGTLATYDESDRQEHLSDLAVRAADQVRRSLGLPGPSPTQVGAARAELPSSPEAARLYAVGLDRLRAVDVAAARQALEQAVALEDGSAVAHMALARSLGAVGYNERARAEAKRALELSAVLPRDDQLEAEALYEEMASQWDHAVELRRALWTFHPDRLDYGLDLATLEIKAGRARDALATAGALQRMPAPANADPRIDLVIAAADESSGDFEAGRAAARAAGGKAQLRGETALLAYARHWEGMAAQELRDVPGEHACLAEARRLFHELGDRADEGRSARALALGLIDEGELDEGAAILDDVVAIFRSLDKQDGLGATLDTQAALAEERDDLAKANELRREALLHLGVGGGSRFLMSGVLNNMAMADLERGEVEAARGELEQALALEREAHKKSGESISLEVLGLMAFLTGDLDTASARSHEAADLASAIGKKDVDGGARAVLGRVQLSRGDLAGATRTFRAAVETMHEADDLHEEVSTRGWLVYALVCASNRAEAGSLAEETLTRARESKIPSVIREAEIAAAFASGASGVGGVVDAAVAALDGLAGQAAEKGWARQRLLALERAAELELRTGRTTSGRARMRALKEQARDAGFGGAAAPESAGRQVSSR